MAKRGNPGYGKMENIRLNVDKFSPVFWKLMEEFVISKSEDDKRFFIQEFNKIQTKMIPKCAEAGRPIKSAGIYEPMQHTGQTALRLRVAGTRSVQNRRAL